MYIFNIMFVLKQIEIITHRIVLGWLILCVYGL